MSLVLWQSLDESLAQAMADAENRRLSQSILRTDRPEQIGKLLQSFCLAQFGASIAACGLSCFSVGATFAVVLTNGSKVVLKACGLDKNLAALQAATQVQMVLAQAGFPCPQILVAPQVWQSTALLAQTYVDGGDRVDGFAPTARRVMAHHLAELIQLTKYCNQFAADLPPWMPWLQNGDTLWPKPHNVLFDFKRTAAGAEWIDQIAAMAQRVLLNSRNDSELVIGHSDWSLQNMAFRADELVCVYDWDSLRVGQEVYFVGGAARCFAHDWRFHAPVRSITLEEVLAFVQEYEAARGASFSASEWQRIGAAMVYTAAYGARCAHSGDRSETEHSLRTKQQLKAFAAYFLNKDF